VEFEHRGNSDRGVRRKGPVLRLKLTRLSKRFWLFWDFPKR
jgi:hypothetical protein